MVTLNRISSAGALGSVAWVRSEMLSWHGASDMSGASLDMSL